MAGILGFFSPAERRLRISLADMDGMTFHSNNQADTLVSIDALHLNLESAAGMVNILKGIDLKIATGETVSIVGPSGSGKTSLMMLMAGLERPTEGSIVIDGKDVGSMSEDALALFRRDTIGIVFQNFHLVPTMTALENVAVPLEFAGATDALDRAEDSLKAVGLGHRLTHYPSQLSGGEQQRTALARAFVAAPKLMLADEPTGNLDQDTGETIMELLFDLRDRHGTTLMLITHNPELAERCGRTIRLVNGLIESDSAAAVSATAAI